MKIYLVFILLLLREVSDRIIIIIIKYLILIVLLIITVKLFMWLIVLRTWKHNKKVKFNC